MNDAERSQKMIDFIKQGKVVMLEDVAAEFKMLTKEVVTRIEQLEKEKAITGIFDDRGKYIHISSDEFDILAAYINRAGRVNRSEL